MLDNCANHNINGDVYLVNAKCNYCNLYSVFYNYQNHYICQDINKYQDTDIIAFCLKYDDNFKCKLC